RLFLLRRRRRQTPPLVTSPRIREILIDPREHKIFDQQHTEPVPRPDHQRWRDREVLFYQLCGRLPELLADGFTERVRGAVAVRVETTLVMIGRPIGRGSHS